MNDNARDALESAIIKMHMLFADLIAGCEKSREHGGFYLDHFDEAVTAAMEAVIKVKQAQSVRMRSEMGMGDQHEAN